MTPTPEDIALADELDRGIYTNGMGYPTIRDDAAQLIAAHTAPLRELAEIGRLAVETRRAFKDPAATSSEYIARGDRMTAACTAYLAKRPTT